MTDADRTHRKIDDAYDVADRVVEGVGRVLGVDVNAGQAKSAKNANPLPAAASSTAKALPAAASPVAAPPITPPTAIESKPVTQPFRIVESLDEKGVKTFTVTNGIATADCKSRAFAEQVLVSINAGAIAPASTSQRFITGGRGRGRRGRAL